MGSGISLVMSCWNRTAIFNMSYPTWLGGSAEYPTRTLPDEIIIVNDGGATDIVGAVQQMEKLIADWKLDIPVYYQHRDKGHTAWSNPAIPHNWLVREALGPVVVIIDPEVAFVNDVLGYIHSFYFDEDYDGEYNAPLEQRRRASCAAGTIYSIQSEFMHVAAGIPAHEVPNHPEFISSNPTTHQIIIRGGAVHECRAWWKERYIAIGGKDERYVAWGYEDLDMEHRNVRFQPPGWTSCDSRAIVVGYGHLMPPCVTGSESASHNEQRWRMESPADGVANRGQEWGVIK